MQWLYSCNYDPMKNLEIRRYKCGHYVIRSFITSPSGAYVFHVIPFQRTKKNNLIKLLENYTLYASEVRQ